MKFLSRFFKEKKSEQEPNISIRIVNLNGNFFTLGKMLGKGSGGVVYEGTWNGKIAAIKVFSSENKSAFESCQAESDLMMWLDGLKAPNTIVQFYGCASSPSSFYIGMEYMSRGTLGDYIYKKPFIWQIRYRIIKDIANGLQFLHRYKIIHRDIKIWNILLDANYRGKIGDFGSASQEGCNKFELLSLDWIAPEVLKTKPHTAKSDIYSFAMTLWSIAEWDLPYFYLSEQQVIAQVPNGFREPISSECPAKLAKLITWGWQDDPNRRPTAAEIMAELDSDMDEVSERLAKLTF